MKTKVLLSGVVLSVILMINACTQLRTPAAPPGMETATAIAQATQTAEALQTAGINAQQTATALAIIVLSYTPTHTVTAPPTATPTEEHGFRVKTLNMYMDNVLVMTSTYSYASGVTPLAASLVQYDTSGNFAGTADATYDIAGNTVSAVYYDTVGTVTKTVSGTVSGGRVTRLDEYDGSGTLISYKVFSYDGSGRCVREEIFSSSGVSLEYAIYSYDSQGRRYRSDYYNSSGYTSGKESIYNSAGSIIRENTYGLGGSLSTYTAYTLNSQGLQASGIVYTAGGVQIGTAAFVYDASWNLTRLTSVMSFMGSGMSSDMINTYDANNNLTTTETNIDYGGGMTAKIGCSMTWEVF